jgi:hypothetical protein
MAGRKRALYCEFSFFTLEESPLNTSFRYLYLLYIAVDANFKLKGKERRLKDIELMPGWGAYVAQDEYHSHISNYVHEVEVCHVLLLQ